MRSGRVANGSRGRGFTALEALIAASILAFLTAAVSGALMAGRQQTKFSRDTLYASMLARGLLDEIMRLPTTDPLGYTTIGPDSGEVRIPVFGSGQTQFNCVKDYHGYTDGPGMVNGVLQTTQITQLALTADAAVAYPSVYQPFVRTVTVTPVSYTPTAWGQTLTGLLVTVTVSRDGAPLVTLQRVAFY
jgi:hypothetical protein